MSERKGFGIELFCSVCGTPLTMFYDNKNKEFVSDIQYHSAFDCHAKLYIEPCKKCKLKYDKLYDALKVIKDL